MKSTTTWLLLILAAQTAPAQDFLQDWESVLSRTDILYQESFEGYQRELRAAQKVLDSWLPLVHLTPQFSLSQTQNSLSQSVGLGLSVNQKLPLGGRLSLSLQQDMNFENSWTPLASSTRTIAALTQPLLGWDQGFGLPAGNLSDAYHSDLLRGAQVSWQVLRQSRVIATYTQVIGAGLLSRRQTLRKRLWEWYQKNQEADLILLNSGRLSTLELSDRGERLRLAEQAWLNGEKSLGLAEAELKVWGLTPETVREEDWLRNLETTPSWGGDSAQQSHEAELIKLKAGRYTQWQSEGTQLPELQVNYHLTPELGNPPGDWSLSVQLRIPLSPWDPLYAVGAEGRSERTLLDLKLQQIQNSRDQQEESQKKNLEVLRLSVHQAQVRWELERDRLELYRLKSQAGQLSPDEADFQAIQTDLASLDALDARLNLQKSLWLGGVDL